MILRIENLRAGYAEDDDILRGMNLDVSAGRAVGIIGLNGSGKSTLAKAVMNMLPFLKGTIIFKGQKIAGRPTHELSESGITLFMQGGRIFDELTVRENLEFAANRKPIPPLTEAIEFYASGDNVSYNLRERADRLSGGKRHRLALAMCLLRDPKLLILDEPSAGLDPRAVKEMYETLHELRRRKSEMSLLLIEQNIARAVEFCDTVHLLRDGVIAKTWSDRNMNDIEQTLFG